MTIDEPAEQKYRPEGEGGKDSAATGGKGERDKRGDPPAPETADGEQGGKDGAATGSKGGEGDKSGTRAHPVQRLKVSRAEKGAALEQMKYRNGSEREESPLPMPQLPPSQPQARYHSRRLRHLRRGRRRYCPCFFSFDTSAFVCATGAAIHRQAHRQAQGGRHYRRRQRKRRRRGLKGGDASPLLYLSPCRAWVLAGGSLRPCTALPC